MTNSLVLLVSFSVGDSSLFLLRAVFPLWRGYKAIESKVYKQIGISLVINRHFIKRFIPDAEICPNILQKYCGVHAARCLQYVWQFFNIINEMDFHTRLLPHRTSSISDGRDFHIRVLLILWLFSFLWWYLR